MIGGIVVGVRHLVDRVDLVIEGDGDDSHIEVTKSVYPTGLAKMIRCGDTVWWQAGKMLWNGGIKKEDVPLVLIRQNDGDDNLWPYDEAAQQAGVKST
jgi:hypothetical protein